MTKLGVVSAYAPKDEREIWEARVYLRLLFEDLALLFSSALVGHLPDWSRSVGRSTTVPLKQSLVSKSKQASASSMSAPYTAGCARGCTLSVGHYGGCIIPPPGKRAPCAAGHDTDAWCEYCLPPAPTPAA